VATDTTLKAALRRFGLNVETHIGAPWTYLLPTGDVVHLCWKEGSAISWPSSASGTLTYRDTFDDFDPAKPGSNALDSFALLQAAQARDAPIRCIMVAGSKQTGTKYVLREDLAGTVTMAIAEPGKGIEIVFRKRQDHRN
jgi:hypothetical protein